MRQWWSIAVAFAVGLLSTAPRLVEVTLFASGGMVAIWLWEGEVIGATTSWDYYVRSIGITISEIGTIVLIGVAILKHVTRESAFVVVRWVLEDTLIVGLGVAILISWVLHPALDHTSLRVVGRWMAALALYFVVKNSMKSSARNILLVMVWSAALAGIVGLVQLFTHNAEGGLAAVFSPQVGVQNLVGTPIGRVRALFGSATEYGSYLAIVIPIWASLGLELKNAVFRSLWAMAGVVLLIDLVGTATRGAWIGVAVGLMYLIWQLSGRRRGSYLMGIGAAAAGVWLWLSYEAKGYTIARLGPTVLLGSASRRFAIYQRAVSYLWQHPLGGGAGAFNRVPNLLAFGNTENAVLHVGVEFGIPAALLLLVILARFSFPRLALGLRRPEVIGMAAAVLSLSVRSVVDPTVSAEPQVLLLFAIVLGLMGRTLAQQQKEVGHSTSQSRIRPSVVDLENPR